MKDTKETKKPVYCAAYCRKSVEERAEETFGSIENQHEAILSFIASHKHEGWIAIDERYDDNGFTGSNTNRPSLQKLINDIKKGRVNMVVVYKLDRLSRSLVDFVQLLKFFEEHDVAFASITQPIDTSTSTGKLMLHILSSFAEFERELISERTRDKMGAARKRGQWMGGRPPFGYNKEKDSKKLTVNPEEANTVREIFKLYLEDNSLLGVAQILNNRGLRSRKWIVKKTGKSAGGKRFGVGQIQSLVNNVLYIGKVCYAGQIYAGQQEAIIDEGTFKRAQEKLKINRFERKATKHTDCTGLLTHLLYCPDCGSVMFHTYTLKHRTHKYRYYVCTNAQKRGYSICPTRSINAQAIEDAVIKQLKVIFSNRKLANTHPRQEAMGVLFSSGWDALTQEEKRKVIKNLVVRVDYSHAAKQLSITPTNGIGPIGFEIDLKRVRHLNKWHKEIEVEKEPFIRRNLVLAYQIERLFEENKTKDFKQTSGWLNMSPTRVSQIILLNFLSTKIKTDILMLPREKLNSISDNTLRKIATEADWEKQNKLWHAAFQYKTPSLV